MPSLPLFPLGTVLLPGSTLPLVVFEPRYVTLLGELVGTGSASEPAFGVVAIRKGQEVGPDNATELYDVGCEAVIEQVTGDAPPFHIITRGRRRFRITGRDEGAGTPYVTGLVTWLDPVDASAGRQRAEAEGDHGSTAALARLAADVRAAHAQLLTILGAAHRDMDDVDPDQLAYRVVERSALELRDRQRVLEAPSAADRLRVLRRILRRELTLVTEVRAVPGRIDPGTYSPN